jgi:serine/threonine-protein kinase
MVEVISRCQLLKPHQRDELVQTLQRRFTEPKALAKELLERDWLTAYQINHLLQGRDAELVLGPYVLVERLGEGGTGWVFKAWHVNLHRLVAVKVLRRELLTDPEVIARFYREIQVVSGLSHPNVVHAYDAGPIGQAHVLVMEYAEGVDLMRLVKRSGPLPVAQACDYVRQAASGLAHIHARGQLHRDVKPSNLLVTWQRGSSSEWDLTREWGTVKVLDLGLARLGKVAADRAANQLPAGSTTAQLTPDGAIVVGTPDYLAPEQAADFHQADVRADIYSLGCTLFYLLTGQAPFPGGSLAQKLVRHQFQEPPDIRQFRPEVPGHLVAILGRMLAKQRDDRFLSATNVVDALEGKADAVPATAPRLEEPPPLAISASPLRKRKVGRRVLTAVAAVLAGIGGLLLWSMFVGTRHGSPRSTAPPPPQPVPIPTLFSTGLGADGKPLPDGAMDPHWSLSPVPPSMLTNLVFATINAPPIGGPWLANTATSRWISPKADPRVGEAPGTFTYKTNFDLNGYDASSTRVTAQVAVEHEVTDVRLNGVSLRRTARGSAAFTRLTLAGRFASGINVLEFVVVNKSDRLGPTGLRVELTGVAVPLSGPFPPPTLVNPGFESPPLGTGPLAYVYASGGGWTFGGAPGVGSGLTANNTAFTNGNPAAPEGLQVAFLQSTGVFAQSVLFPAGTYTVSFQAAQRAGFNKGGQDFQVYVDNQAVGTFFPTTTTYQSYATRPFTVTDGPHVIHFRGMDTRGGDNTVFIDAVKIGRVP